MTKRVYIIITLALCAALLTGCVGRSVATEPTEAPTASPTSEPTATPEPPSTEPDPTASPEKNGMYDLLTGVFDNYHFGTAGSSLKGAWYAAAIVDWSVKNGGAAVVNGARAWDRGLETEYGESFAEKLTSVYAIAMSLYGQGKGVLTDCGWEGAWDHSTGEIRTAFEPLFPALGMEAPVVWRVYYPDAEVMHLRAEGVLLEQEDLVDITKDLNAALDGYVLREEALILRAELDGGVLALELNDALAEQIRSYGTSGEYLTIAAIVNTALDNLPEARSVRLTVKGAPLETGHNIYDTDMTFIREEAER